MPKDVPPRPGAPGYDEFIAHQQRLDGAGPGPAAPGAAPQAGAPGAGAVAPAAVPATTATVQPKTVARPVGTPAPATRPLPPAYAPADDKSAARGGLYQLRHAGAQQIVEVDDADRAIFLDHEQGRDF